MNERENGRLAVSQVEVERKNDTQEIKKIMTRNGSKWLMTRNGSSLFRKVFDYRTWESVTELQHRLQRPTWEELVNYRQQRFPDRIAHCDITHRLPVP